ncbi:hypothetical protein CHELA20_40246 [Hyphomicrobiales bacterium]|nr:hypothetical protein CHELA20_40246 [Hyphomicrobiales bacterium]CAH1687872.1 hypothetical protein CHELA41_40102 [Hyphomicrobiales bacterium]
MERPYVASGGKSSLAGSRNNDNPYRSVPFKLADNATYPRIKATAHRVEFFRSGDHDDGDRTPRSTMRGVSGDGVGAVMVGVLSSNRPPRDVRAAQQDRAGL